MTLQDFERVRTDIVKQHFTGEFADPLVYGIQRGKFEQQKLQRLIDLGKDVKSRTVQAKVMRWQRQIKRIEERVTRLQKLKADIEASRIRIGLPNRAAEPKRVRVE